MGLWTKHCLFITPDSKKKRGIKYYWAPGTINSISGLDINWCKSSDAGLPKPDRVFFLTLPAENVAQRNGFGNER